jgi:hypothetical protein
MINDILFTNVIKARRLRMKKPILDYRLITKICVSINLEIDE